MAYPTDCFRLILSDSTVGNGSAWGMTGCFQVAARGCEAAELPEIQYFVAFALNRRNLKGDRAKALSICDRLVFGLDPLIPACQNTPRIDI